MRWVQLFTVIAFAFSFTITPAWAGIKGVGRAEIFNNNLGAAKKQARRNALRDAVEQGVGTLIDAHTKVKNWQVIRDEIYTSSRGFVTQYKVLRSSQEGSAWVIEIDAKVATASLKNKLEELRILHKKMGNKRLMVIYLPQDPRALEPEHNAVLAALSNLQTHLNNAGFRVFDQKSVDRIEGLKRTREQQNTAAWIQIATEQQADILAEFEVSSNVGGRGGQMIQAAKVTLKLRIYDVSTGRMIANQFTTQKALTNARPGSYGWRTALASASQKAADQVAEEGIKNIIDYYVNVGDLGNAFLMRFTGFSEDEEDQILDSLENLDGYQSLSEIKNNTEMIEIEYFSRLKKSRLRRKIRLATRKQGIRIRSQTVSGNRFEWVKQY